MSRTESPPGCGETLPEKPERVTVRVPSSMLTERNRIVNAGIYKDWSKAICGGTDAVVEDVDVLQEKRP